MQSRRINNLVFPSGTVNLYARVIDSFGAVSSLYADTVEVGGDSRRSFTQAEWDEAFAELTDFVMLKSTQDVNKLASAISMEAVKQYQQSAVSLSQLTQIVSTVVDSLHRSVSASAMTSSFACEVIGVLVFATTPGASSTDESNGFVTGNSTLDSDTLATVSAMVDYMLQSPSVTSVSGQCLLQFYTVLNNVVAAQNLLSKANAIAPEVSKSIVTYAETSSFQVASLLARSMISGESKEVSTVTSSTMLSRQLGSSTSTQEVSLSDQTLSVWLPSLAGRRFGSEQVAASDLLTSFVSLSSMLPVLPGIEPLSHAITISISKGNSKTPLDVKGLPDSDAVKFTVPLSKPVPPPPPQGQQFRCEDPTCASVIRSTCWHVAYAMCFCEWRHVCACRLFQNRMVQRCSLLDVLIISCLHSTTFPQTRVEEHSDR